MFFGIVIIVVSLLVMFACVKWADADEDDLARKIILSLLQINAAVTLLFGMFLIYLAITRKPVVEDAPVQQTSYPRPARGYSPPVMVTPPPPPSVATSPNVAYGNPPQTEQQGPDPAAQAPAGQNNQNSSESTQATPTNDTPENPPAQAQGNSEENPKPPDSSDPSKG